MNRYPNQSRSRLWRWLMLLLALVALALALALVYWLRPGWMLDGYFAAQRWHAGVKEGDVSVAGANWRYVEGGSGEPVLLLHGMAGSKENWLLLAPHLTGAYRVIAPDQAGFGGSAEALDNDYRISAQVERLREFVDAMKLQRFHLVGHSMGGHTAGVFAARYPERVQTLTLMSAAGVPFKANAFQALIERGENPFATETIEKFDAFMRMTFEHPPFAPPRLRQAYADRNAPRAWLWNGILRRIVSPKTRYFLQSKLADIKAPTLVLWCDRDQLLDVSSVDAFRAGLPQARIEILQGCGHMPMMEKPVETATLLRQQFAM
jgi:abhydrolase domain-containing protein 6